MQRLGVQVEVDAGQAASYFRYFLNVRLIIEVAAHVKAYPMDSACLYPRDHLIDEVVSEAGTEILPSGMCNTLPLADLRFERCAVFLTESFAWASEPSGEIEDRDDVAYLIVSK